MVPLPPLPHHPPSHTGKQAVFEVEVLEIRTRVLPEWDEQLAERVRPGLSLAELEAEVCNIGGCKVWLKVVVVV